MQSAFLPFSAETDSPREACLLCLRSAGDDFRKKKDKCCKNYKKKGHHCKDCPKR